MDGAALSALHLLGGAVRLPRSVRLVARQREDVLRLQVVEREEDLCGLVLDARDVSQDAGGGGQVRDLEECTQETQE